MSFPSLFLSDFFFRFRPINILFFHGQVRKRGAISIPLPVKSEVQPTVKKFHLNTGRLDNFRLYIIVLSLQCIQITGMAERQDAISGEEKYRGIRVFPELALESAQSG